MNKITGPEIREDAATGPVRTEMNGLERWGYGAAAAQGQSQESDNGLASAARNDHDTGMDCHTCEPKLPLPLALLELQRRKLTILGTDPGPTPFGSNAWHESSGRGCFC